MHFQCDKLSASEMSRWAAVEYECPPCRRAPPGELLSLPSRHALSTSVACAGCLRTEKDLGCRCVPTQVTPLLLARLGLSEALSHDEIALCPGCTRRCDSDEYCPLCERLYIEPEASAQEGAMPEEMLLCETCGKWVHVQCDGLPEQVRVRRSRARATDDGAR